MKDKDLVVYPTETELVKGNLQPGVYEYKFDGTGLGSGVYFYKLQSGEFTETRRMVLVK